eukprot:8138781-Ditylum_brightwellii.AAC.1
MRLVGQWSLQGVGEFECPGGRVPFGVCLAPCGCVPFGWCDCPGSVVLMGYLFSRDIVHFSVTSRGASSASGRGCLCDAWLLCFLAGMARVQLTTMVLSSVWEIG